MKENMSNELVERYLYDVVRRLPEKQRKDIEQELRTLIEDMIAEREEAGEESSEECIKSVLNELGSPSKLAKSYRGDADSLISGEYYDKYCYILKIVLICAGAGILISNIVSAIVHVVEAEGAPAAIWNDMVNIGNIPMVLIQTFGIITLIFAVMERNKIKANMPETTAWSPEKLPEIPYKKSVISRGESAAGIVFTVLVMILFVFAPQLMGAWMKQGETMVSIPLFNLSIWRQVLPLFIIAFGAGIVEEFVKLFVGKYNFTVMTVTIIMDTIGFAATFIIFKMFPIWNSNFMVEFQQVTGKIFSAKHDIMSYFNTNTFTNGFLAFMLFCFLLDIGTTVYYTVRYGNNKEIR